MNDQDKKQFFEALATVGKLHNKTPDDVRGVAPLYWQALKHRTIADVLQALNEHVRDTQRGRFFPLPADIEDKLPAPPRPWHATASGIIEKGAANGLSEDQFPNFPEFRDAVFKAESRSIAYEDDRSGCVSLGGLINRITHD